MIDFKIKKLPLERYLESSFLLIVILLPFHAFFTTWFISNMGHPELIKSWKEIVLFGFMVPISIVILFKNSKIYQKVIKRKVNQLVLAFILLNILYSIFVPNDFEQSAAGLLFNLRFFVFFLVAQIIAESLKGKNFIKLIVKIIFITGSFVVIFGTLQVLLLPIDWLSHFGYSLTTIPPYFTVDNNINDIRILSTLRGPNILGEYLVLWIPLLVLFSLKKTTNFIQHNFFVGFLWLCTMITLFGTKSRGALIGVFISTTLTLLLIIKNKKYIYLIMGIVASMSILLISLNINSNTVQNLIFHRNQQSSSISGSDDQRISSYKLAINSVKQSPLGCGVGCAGPASNYGGKTLIVENYYLQTIVELSIIGGVLFVVIIILTAIKLFKRRNNKLISALFSSFIALSIVNLFMPGWSDGTVSLIWWGLAGLSLYCLTDNGKYFSKEN